MHAGASLSSRAAIGLFCFVTGVGWQSFFAVIVCRAPEKAPSQRSAPGFHVRSSDAREAQGPPRRDVVAIRLPPATSDPKAPPRKRRLPRLPRNSGARGRRRSRLPRNQGAAARDFLATQASEGAAARAVLATRPPPLHSKLTPGGGVPER